MTVEFKCDREEAPQTDHKELEKTCTHLPHWKTAAARRCEGGETDVPQDPQKDTTKEYYTTCNLPPRWDRPYWFNGYGSQQVPLPNPFYRSTYMDYGWYPPNIHTVPVSYFPTHQSFTKNLGTCGMYRNSSLNTSLDRRLPGE